MTKKILLTGGTGFLGSYILAALVQQGYTVYALRRGSTTPHWIDAALLEKVQWITGDVLDIVGLEEAMENVDAVIHAAAMVSFNASERKELYQINVEGTANVVNACLEKKVKRLVHVSSVAALGRKVGGGLVDEKAKWEENPLQTHYARSKYKAELHVWRGHCEGLDTVILNPSTILGFGDWTKTAAYFSSLSITELAKQILHPERVIGLHFFNPATLMKLVEVVQTPFTKPEILETAIALIQQIGKTAVVCTDAPGFIVNRVARPYYIESLRLAEEKAASIEQIDRLLESAGFRMGPFRLMDLIGNDINYAVSCSVYEQLGKPSRLEPSWIQQQLVQQGKWGKKSGEGYYTYHS